MNRLLWWQRLILLALAALFLFCLHQWADFIAGAQRQAVAEFTRKAHP